MIIFLYGEDTYRSSQKLKEIVDHYKEIHKSGLNLRYLDCDQISFEEFKGELNTIPMFKEKKLIVFKNTFSDQKTENKLTAIIKNLKNTEDIILIYADRGIDKRSQLFKFLNKNAKCQEFQSLDGQMLKDWIKKEFNKYNTDIDKTVIEKFINYSGSDSWHLANEITKLINYKNRGKIELKDIELLVRPEVETDIFETIEAIALKNKKQAIKLIHKHLEQGDSPLYLLSMINFQFRNLLIIKYFVEKRMPYYSISNLLRLHPFVFKKSYFQSSKFSFPELKKIYQKIFQADLAIKKGKLDPESAIDYLVTEI